MTSRALPALLLLAALLPAPAAAVAPTPPRELLLEGDESVATTEGARAMLFNPAALGLRYPSELRVSWSRLQPRGEVNHELLALGGFGLMAERVKDRSQAYGFAIAGGGEPLRVGLSTTWHVDAASHEVKRDERLGLLSRPAPWLSLGAAADHLFQPDFQSVRLGRLYHLGIGFRPLALRRASAYTLGSRLTLSTDFVIPDDGSFSQTRVRIGGELELAPGLAVRGAIEDHGGVHLAVGIWGPRWGFHAQRATVDGAHRADTYNVSLHSGDERSVLASKADRRVAVIRASGHLGDDRLSGMTVYGPVGSALASGLHQQLERALEDPYTQGVLLELNGVSTMAQLEELRPRIRRLRAAGKPVVAYLENGGGRGDLYLAAACDKIVTSPEAVWVALGLRSERRSYRTALADLGLRFDRASYGKYKSAYRNLSTDSTTAVDREVTEHLLDQIQEMFVSTVATDRHMPRERLVTVLDGRWWPPAELQKAGVIDSIGYREDAVRILGRMCGMGDTPRGVSLPRVPPARRAWTVPTRLAVVYATGAIEEGASGSDLLMGPYMGSATVSRQIARAFKQPGVKAVVLRVESPGGSSLGSDLIAHAAERARRESKKPLIVSMGSVAASGGYMISIPGDRIFADRFTYTGSIGVLVVKPSLEGFYRKHGVHQEDFDRGRYMRGMSWSRDWDREVQASADSSIYADYLQFVGHVAAARKLPFEQVEPVAQGRVWMADEARDHKLVDEIGGIRLAEYRRPSPPLIERLVGRAVGEAWERVARLPEPGEHLLWADDDLP